MIELLRQTYKDKTVLVTGHTGFKGSWLSFWLELLGADVHGFALPPAEPPSCFEDLRIAARCVSTEGDIRNAQAVASTLARSDPEIVFHLAAQPLVREGWHRPRETIDVNVMGTANVLDAAARHPSVEAVVVVTTDKCYENIGSAAPLRESDRLGGHDPYSASKAAAELVVGPYLRGELMGIERPPAVATARGGNVLGGGDRGADRLVPDLVRAIEAGSPVTLRRPDDVRPWQHVIDCLSGYLVLGHHLLNGTAGAAAYNFGPGDTTSATVLELAELFLRVWGATSTSIRVDRDQSSREAAVLRLDPRLAKDDLGWSAIWGWERTVRETAEFYRSKPSGRVDLARAQLDRYMREAQLAWAP